MNPIYVEVFIIGDIFFGTSKLIMKNCGAIPVELLNLLWEDIEIEDLERISKSKRQVEIQKLKSECIDDFKFEEEDPNYWAFNESKYGMRLTFDR